VQVLTYCYWSRRIYVNEANKETLFQNISLWSNDITKQEGGMIHSIPASDLFSFSCMFKTNIVLQVWPKYGIYDRCFIRNFFSTIFDCNARHCFEIDNFIDFDDKGNEVEIYNFHLELKKNNGNHIYVRQGLNRAKLGNKINIYKYTDPEGHVFRCDSNGNIIHPLFSVNDEVYIDSKGNEIIVTSPDTIEWKDTNGNNIAVIKNTDESLSTVNGDKITHVKDNIYLNTKTEE
jgi:hypothetical protein